MRTATGGARARRKSHVARRASFAARRAARLARALPSRRPIASCFQRTGARCSPSAARPAPPQQHRSSGAPSVACWCRRGWRRGASGPQQRATKRGRELPVARSWPQFSVRGSGFGPATWERLLLAQLIRKREGPKADLGPAEDSRWARIAASEADWRTGQEAGRQNNRFNRSSLRALWVCLLEIGEEGRQAGLDLILSPHSAATGLHERGQSGESSQLPARTPTSPYESGEDCSRGVGRLLAVWGRSLDLRLGSIANSSSGIRNVTPRARARQSELRNGVERASWCACFLCVGEEEIGGCLWATC